MFTDFKSAMQSLLIELDVSANIRVFGHRWIEEHDTMSFDDCLTFLDRLDIPFEIHFVNKQITKREALIGLLVNDTECVMYRNENGTLVEAGKDANAIDKNTLSKVNLAVIVTDSPRERPDPDWLSNRLDRYKPILPRLLFLSFIANLFALSIPFITMAVYDHVIGGGASHELPGIAIGALLLFAMMLSMKVLRSQLLVTMGNRISRELSDALFNRTLRSAPEVIERTPLSAMFNRVNLGDRVKSLLQGPLGGALFDLPFLLMFLTAIGILGGWLVIVPILTITIYLFLAHRSQLRATRVPAHTTVAGANRQTMNDELAGRFGFMVASNLIENWSHRFNQASTYASKNAFTMASLQAKYTSAYYFLSIGANLAVIALGIGLIFEGMMSAGGLIATMMLISRVTGPVNMLASSASRFPSARQAKAQINQQHNQKVEGSFSYNHVPLPVEAPSIELDQLTVRYPNQMRPAVSGATLSIEPGQVVAVTGAMGSGKSTFIEAIGGIVSIQNGLAKINGINLNQYDKQLYRHWVGYRSDRPQLLLTRIRDFISDGRIIPDDVMEQSIATAGGDSWLRSLPEGLDTQIVDNSGGALSDTLVDFQGSVLVHAKLLAYKYPLYLLDTPTLNALETEIFMNFLRERRGQSTIIFTTHDKELVQLCDQVVVMDKGAVAYAGAVPDESNESSETSQDNPLPNSSETDS